MRTIKFTHLALVAALCLSQGAAFARPGHGNDNGNDNCGPNCERNQGHGRDDHRDNKDRFENGHDNRRHDGERGAGPDHSFYRGERLPTYYRSPQYVVSDWRGHGLRTPPRGYHWVQSGGDYLLVAITTGVILELLFNN